MGDLWKHRHSLHHGCTRRVIYHIRCHATSKEVAAIPVDEIKWRTRYDMGLKAQRRSTSGCYYSNNMNMLPTIVRVVGASSPRWIVGVLRVTLI